MSALHSPLIEHAPPLVAAGLHVRCEIDVLEPFFDPLHLYDFVSDGIAHLLHSMLTRCDSGGIPRPAIAARWEVDGCDWVFHLRDGFAFDDGTPIHAEHFAQAIHALAGRGVRRWLCTDIASVDARGDDQLWIRTHHPVAYLPSLLANPCFAPRKGDEPRSSGAYRIVERYPDSRGLVLHRSGPASAHTDDGPEWITLLRTDDGEQGIRLFHQGKIDLTCGTIFPRSLATDPKHAPLLHQFPSALLGQLLLNHRRVPEFRSASVRHALSAAIDREQITEQLAPVVQPLRSFSDLFGPDAASARPQPPADDNAAFSPTRLEIIYADFAPNGDLLRLVADALEPRLGCTISLRAMPYTDYLHAVRNEEFDLAYAILPQPFDDPAGWLFAFTNGTLLPTSDIPQSFLRAYRDAAAVTDPAYRHASMRHAAAMLDALFPTIPLIRTRICQLVSPALNVPMLANGLPDYARISLRSPQKQDIFHG